MASRLVPPPLIIEQHPIEYKGYPFITLIQFKNTHILCIIDNADESNVHAYVLDLCGACGLNEELIISIANKWYINNSKKYPLSIEFSKHGVTGETQNIYKTFQIEYISRIIGPLPSFKMVTNAKVKRRRKKQIQPKLITINGLHV